MEKERSLRWHGGLSSSSAKGRNRPWLRASLSLTVLYL